MAARRCVGLDTQMLAPLMAGDGRRGWGLQLETELEAVGALPACLRSVAPGSRVGRARIERAESSGLGRAGTDETGERGRAGGR